MCSGKEKSSMEAKVFFYEEANFFCWKFITVQVLVAYSQFDTQLTDSLDEIVALFFLRKKSLRVARIGIFQHNPESNSSNDSSFIKSCQ